MLRGILKALVYHKRLTWCKLLNLSQRDIQSTYIRCHKRCVVSIGAYKKLLEVSFEEIEKGERILRRFRLFVLIFQCQFRDPSWHYISRIQIHCRSRFVFSIDVCKTQNLHGMVCIKVYYNTKILITLKCIYFWQGRVLKMFINQFFSLNKRLEMSYSLFVI